MDKDVLAWMTHIQNTTDTLLTTANGLQGQLEHLIELTNTQDKKIEWLENQIQELEYRCGLTHPKD